MLPITTFTFNASDGIHQYKYNPNAKISSFELIKGKYILIKQDCYCASEDYHIKRVLKDFNENNRILPNYIFFNIKYLWKYSRTDIYLLFGLICLFLALVNIGLFCIVSLGAMLFNFATNIF